MAALPHEGSGCLTVQRNGEIRGSTDSAAPRGLDERPRFGGVTPSALTTRTEKKKRPANGASDDGVRSTVGYQIRFPNLPRRIQPAPMPTRPQAIAKKTDEKKSDRSARRVVFMHASYTTPQKNSMLVNGCMEHTIEQARAAFGNAPCSGGRLIVTPSGDLDSGRTLRPCALSRTGFACASDKRYTCISAYALYAINQESGRLWSACTAIAKAILTNRVQSHRQPLRPVRAGWRVWLRE